MYACLLVAVVFVCVRECVFTEVVWLRWRSSSDDDKVGLGCVGGGTVDDGKVGFGVFMETFKLMYIILKHSYIVRIHTKIGNPTHT